MGLSEVKLRHPRVCRDLSAYLRRNRQTERTVLLVLLVRMRMAKLRIVSGLASKVLAQREKQEKGRVIPAPTCVVCRRIGRVACTFPAIFRQAKPICYGCLMFPILNRLRKGRRREVNFLAKLSAITFASCL